MAFVLPRSRRWRSCYRDPTLPLVTSTASTATTIFQIVQPTNERSFARRVWCLAERVLSCVQCPGGAFEALAGLSGIMEPLAQPKAMSRLPCTAARYDTRILLDMTLESNAYGPS